MGTKRISVFIGGGGKPVILEVTDKDHQWNHFPTPAEVIAVRRRIQDLRDKGKVVVRPFRALGVGYVADFLPETGLWGRILRWAARELLKWW